MFEIVNNKNNIQGLILKVIPKSICQITPMYNEKNEITII